VVRAARLFRELLASLDLESWVKTTGGRGLHVVVPLAPQAEWTECLEFSRALSERVASAHPAEYTTEFAKAGRGNKILIDYLRNNRTNTSIAAYSTRARMGRPAGHAEAGVIHGRDRTGAPSTSTVGSVEGLLDLPATAHAAAPSRGGPSHALDVAGLRCSSGVSAPARQFEVRRYRFEEV
jgi:hypothetical protein